MKRFRVKALDCKGQATLLMVTVISLITSVFLFSAADVFRRNYAFRAFDFDQALLNEATVSSFAVIESALERRLWEPPLDKDCLQADKFEVEGELEGGIRWKVSARYDFTTKNYELLASGTYRTLKSYFRKRIKVLDVSDYLLFSGSDKTVMVNRRYDLKSPAAMIGRDRRLYTKGPLSLAVGELTRTNPKLDWSGSAPNWPADFGMIFQGERMQFAGGISLYSYPIMQPNPEASNIQAMLGPYSAPYGQTIPYNAQQGSGYAIFTRNFDLASTLLRQVQTGSSGPLSYGLISRNVYPIALFSGTPPLLAWNANDTGDYFNDVYRQSVFYFNYAGENGFGTRANYTCIQRSGGGERSCSNSEEYPRSFASWRRNADLEGVLYTSDAEAVPAPRLGWDHLESLEEDARKCGAVIEEPVNDYLDCPIWDANFLNRYASGTGPSCQRVSRIDMESISLNNFNPALYASTENRERFSRRVIYLKVPAEIVQSNPKGLMTGVLSSEAARKNMSLWIVSADMIALRGYQHDTTSPLETQPERLREVVFNQDAVNGGSPAETPSLPIVLLSPEQVHILSPFYQPMTSALLAASMPVSGGFIRPVRHNYTEHTRHENDGYRYGFRRFVLKNVSLIMGAQISPSQSFFMRGLWHGGSDSSARQYISNQCMVSLAGHQMTPVYSNSLYKEAFIPSYHSAPNSPIPPPTSRFYNGRNQFAPLYYPAVFQVQQTAMTSNRQESEIEFTGLRINTQFVSGAPSGRRSLTSSLYAPVDTNTVNTDLSHKVITWDLGAYYQALPPQTPCLKENIRFRQTGPADPVDRGAIYMSVNSGRHILVQNFPDETYRSIGAVVGVEHPVVESLHAEEL